MVRLVAIPGCRRGCDERGWSVSDLKRRTGLSWITCQLAYKGEPVAPSTIQAIIAAFEAAPVSQVARELFEEA